MISFEVYKVLHLAGIALILLGLGTALGAYATSNSIPGKIRMAAFMSHGLGLILALTGGFGMAARLGLTQGLPTWIYGKLVIWLLFGIGISLVKRRARWALPLILFFTLLLALGAGLAIWKPALNSNSPAVSAQ